MTVRVIDCARPALTTHDQMAYEPDTTHYHSRVVVEVDTIEGTPHTRRYARFIGPSVAVRTYRTTVTQRTLDRPLTPTEAAQVLKPCKGDWTQRGCASGTPSVHHVTTHQTPRDCCAYHSPYDVTPEKPVGWSDENYYRSC